MSTSPFATCAALPRRALLACALTTLSAMAHADGPFSHPALRAAARASAGWVQARDAAPLLVGHPASPRWAFVHANQEHPAVLLARRTTSAIDPNTFLVQPPATARWTNPAGHEVEVAVGGVGR